MRFSLLEEAVLHAALSRYQKYCQECLESTANTSQETFISADLEVTQRLQKLIKQDYLQQGGDASLL